MSDKLTFNEALKEINELSFTTDNGESWVNSYTSVYTLIQELQEVYAPTIEMTQEQYHYFKWLRDTNDSLFQAFLTVSYNENELSLFSELDLTQAWLHPETIKVVE